MVSSYDTLEDIEKYMRVVDLEEIKENDYNLNIARYIDTSDEEVIVDINAMLGRISKIEAKEREMDNKLGGFLKELGFVS